MIQIHVLDQQTDKILDVTTEFRNDIHYESLEQQETFNFSVSPKSRIAPYLAKRNRVIIPVDDGFFREFIIFRAEQIQDEKEVRTLASYTELQKEEPISPTILNGATVNTAMDFILRDTGWERGITDYAGIRTIEFEDYIDPYNALKQLSNVDTFNLEIRFRIETNGGKIKRLVDMVERIGTWRGKEIESGKDLISARRIEMNNQVVTALYGVGPVREDGKRYLEVVENEDARQAWGRKRNGVAHHLWKIYEPQTEDADMTRARLRQLTEMELQKRISSAIQWEVEGADIENIFGREHEKVRLGDNARVIATEYNPPIYLESRIIAREGPIREKSQKKYTLGEFIERTEEDVKAIYKRLEKQIAKKIGEAQLIERTYDKQTIDNKDKPGNEAKNKLDADVGSEKIENTEGAQTKADSARDEAKQAVKNGEVPIPAEVISGELDFANTILKNANSTVFTDEHGNTYYVDPDNPNFVVKITSKGIAIGTNGVKGDFNTAMTGGGIIADFVNAGHMSFDRLQGGSATLGGSGNYGNLEVLADDDSTIFRANKDGLVDAEGRELVGKGGVLSQLTFVSSGDFNGWQQVGWWGEGTISEQKAYIYGYIPPNFVVESATLYTYSRPLRFRGWSGITDGYYHCPYIHLITYTDHRDAYLDYPFASEYTNMYRSSTEQILSGASWGGSWHPSGSKDQVITASVTTRLQAGYPFVFGVKTTAPFAQTNKSLILFQLSVTGYKK